MTEVSVTPKKIARTFFGLTEDSSVALIQSRQSVAPVTFMADDIGASMADGIDTLRRNIRFRLKLMPRGAQTRLAKAAGTGGSHMSGFLKEGGHGISTDLLDPIAAFFGVNVPDLFLPVEQIAGNYLVTPSADAGASVDGTNVLSKRNIVSDRNAASEQKVGGHGSTGSEARRMRQLESAIAATRIVLESVVEHAEKNAKAAKGGLRVIELATSGKAKRRRRRND